MVILLGWDSFSLPFLFLDYQNPSPSNYRNTAIESHSKCKCSKREKEKRKRKRKKKKKKKKEKEKEKRKRKRKKKKEKKEKERKKEKEKEKESHPNKTTIRIGFFLSLLPNIETQQSSPTQNTNARIRVRLIESNESYFFHT
jgi:hypothetical protein